MTSDCECSSRRAEVAEIGVMEMSGKTRTRDEDEGGEGGDSVKRRKLVRLRNSQIAESVDRLHERASTSCSGSSERIQFLDLEDTSVEAETSTYYSCRDRRGDEEEEAEACCSESGELDSTAEKSEANSRGKLSIMEEKMPTEDEIEEFFAKAEKQIQKQFAEKYNYDIVKDEPMEGRYEWIRLESIKEN